MDAKGVNIKTAGVFHAAVVLAPRLLLFFYTPQPHNTRNSAHLRIFVTDL
jgi:hypothetical protein